jgi:peptidoglycan/LPS O-acetylase OafA/YrhL
MQKLEGLEALRGLAALAVVGGHFLLAFIPARLGFIPGTEATGIIGNPMFIFVNGSAAVSVFFVLSGFVLSWGAFQRPDDTAMARNLLKRWPRLAGPCAISTVGASLLLALGGHPFEQAGAIAGSGWLQNYAAAAVVPKAVLWPAFMQGAFFTFFRGDVNYNPVLWTMRLELIGSFFVFMLAPLLARAHNRIVPVSIVIVVSLVLNQFEPRLTEFAIGALLACFIARGVPEVPLVAAVPMFAVGIYCLGYYAPRGAYAWLPFKPALFYVWDFGAATVIVLILRNAFLRSIVSGPVARWLGTMSFPIYLVHTPILCVVGSAVFLAVRDHASPRNAILAAWAASIVVTVLSALLLRLFEQWWIGTVNRVAYRVVPRPPSDTAHS